MSKRLYVAYGSNLNLRQMKYRCPGAKLCGVGEVKDYELQFRGQPHGAFATIVPTKGASVPVAVWEISAKNEAALDRYEGYPSHYFKQDISVRLGGEEVNAMVYLMNLRMGFGLPSPYYYQTVYEGYNDCGLDTETLDRAVRESAAQFYAAQRQSGPRQAPVDMENEDMDGRSMEQADPFYFSEGMHL